jgi:hypothetical protein
LIAKSLPGCFDRSPQQVGVVVAVAQYIVSGPRLEKLNHLRRADVATVEQCFDLKAFEHPHRQSRVVDRAMRIANDTNLHASKLQVRLIFHKQ